MTRLAALYDIHGNLPALEAVLAEVRASGVDRVVVGGDVAPGPMVRECLASLRRFEVPTSFILGNSEVAVLATLRGEEPVPMPPSALEMVRASAADLKEDAVFIAGWPKTLRLDVEGIGRVLFCHGTPRHDNEIFTRLTADEKLAPLFRDLGADLVVCGHTHMQFDRFVAGVRVVNAGSVGMRFGGTGADWLLLGPGVELRHTPYDLAAAAARLLASGDPHARDFVARHVLASPPEAQMLEIYGRAELRHGPPGSGS